MRRETVFAGTWYPGDPAQLSEQLDSYLEPRAPLSGRVYGLVSPHAGYMHSGSVAGRAFASIEAPERALVLCPNHRDRRAQRPAFAVAPEQQWDTPLGPINLDQALSQAIVDAVPEAAFDSEAHRQEHAIELQLPFLKALNPNVSIVAISVGTTRYESLVSLGQELAKLLAEDEQTLLLASSDMTHYEPRDEVMRKDQLALARAREFDAEGLLQVCREHQITMCGRAPVAVLLEASRRLGATQVSVLAHDSSRPANGLADGPVVGYAALAVH